MVILFESFGNFTTGQTSYLALVSRKSRGTITLTEKEFLFKTEKDKIIFHLRFRNIQNFEMKTRFQLSIIELISVQGILYTFYPHKNEKSSLATSKKATENLFRQLTRSTFKKESPILFETTGSFRDYDLNEGVAMLDSQKGIIFLNEDFLSFKPFTEKSIYQISILNILKIVFDTSNIGPALNIQTKEGKSYTLMVLKKKLKMYTKDKSKTEKLYELLNQAKLYKSSEQIRLRREEQEKIERIKSMMEVSNRLRLDMIRVALDMDEELFTRKVFQWAKEFNFLIDGDYLIINQESYKEFIEDLSVGTNILSRKGLKMKCRFCEKLIEYGLSICPFCGKETDYS
ncbi:MAG: hypothetical protein KGD67_06080 [Candidatus Lokiarchaeota archaeon]|nr:hypothetical protein [Candidatus Lokiarchaeota archaeon]